MDNLYSDRFLKLRKKLKLTQSEMADKLSVSRVRISQIETGYQKPTLELIQDVINTFSVSGDYFFNSKDDILDANNDIIDDITIFNNNSDNNNERNHYLDRIKSLEEILASKNDLISNQSEMIELLKAQLKSHLKSK
jgi:transcriptional regulator with XRE-family HTH domain